MTSNRRFDNTQQRSPLLFFLLVFLFATPFWLLGTATGMVLMPGLPISALMAICPALAASVLAYRQARWSGVSALLARAFNRPRAKIWLVVAILLPPAWTLLVVIVMRGMGRDLPPLAVSPLAMLAMFAAFFVGALAEELGWSGYAIDPLRQHLGAFPAALVIGLVWALWHFVPLTQVHRGAEWIGWWTLATVALRVIMVWLYDKAGRSVLAVTLLHATSNLCALGLPAYYDPRVVGPVLTVLAAGLILASGRQPADVTPVEGK